MKILRNTDEWVGLLVVACVIVFIVAVLHAGLISDWFRPVAQLRVVLPETGSQGLSAGADIEVLGTRIGVVRRIVVDPVQRMYADAELDEQALAFIRRDSKALIKKRFGVAGAAFLDISRGTAAPLDWQFAVIDAVSERDPTENIGAILDEVKQKIFPILDDAARTMHALADLTEGIAQGRGNIGKLLNDEGIAKQVSAVLDNLKSLTEQVSGVIAEARTVAASASGNQGVPAMLRRVDDLLASVQSAARDLAKTTPQLPAITKNVAGTTANLPALLTQAQATTAELEKLLYQLRHTWPLAGAAPPDTRRLSPAEVRP